MSWDVLLFGFEGARPSSMESLAEDFKPPVLGTAGQVRQVISKYFGNVDWSHPTWGMFSGEGFTIEFSIGKDQAVDGIMLHIRGGGMRSGRS